MGQTFNNSNETVRCSVPDNTYWREQIKCQSACPVNTDARGYVRAIAEGKDELAYLIARGPNPLASICGRVCGAPCEQACRRGEIDQPISIRALKRYVCERHGSEARSDGGNTLLDFVQSASQKYEARQCQGREEYLPFLSSLTKGKIPPVDGNKSVGIIGSGPAGLAAAHDLALLGFSVTIYEMESMLGGMLTLGIPEYRLPRDLVQAETDVIKALGVQEVLNCSVGVDVSFTELRERHDAVIVAVGAQKSRMIPIPGSDAKGVLGGVEMLRDVSLGKPIELGEKVVVIGGGNVAYDVGRTELRQIAIDAARTAKRASGVADVSLCSLESLEEMPADDIEIIEGDEEGVRRFNSLGPTEILVDENNQVTAVRFQRCTRVFDDEKRFSPEFDKNDITEIPCDTVLIAIGQSYDISFIDSERDGLEMTDRGLIRCDPETGVTSAPDVFVAGDLAYGMKLLIHAVASGKSVARAIYEHFTGQEILSRDVELHLSLPDFQREENYEKQWRVEIDSIPVSERLKAQDRVVEKGYSCEQARCEAARCLDCGVNTIFDGARCILCAGCVDVCPEHCLQLISLSQLAPDGSLRESIDLQLNGFLEQEASAIIKDETSCIRCALCAERCPTGAITMERFIFKETLLCQDA